MMIRAFQNAALFLVLVSCCTIKSTSAAEQNDLNKVLSAIILEMNNEGVFAEYWYVMMCIVCLLSTGPRTAIEILIVVLIVVYAYLPSLFTHFILIFARLLVRFFPSSLICHHYRNLYFRGTPVSVPSTCKNNDNNEFVAVENADTSLTNVLDTGIVRVGLSRVAGSFPLLYANETTDDGNYVVSTDLEGLNGNEFVLDGYEIASATEAVRRLGVKYNMDLVPFFDVLPGPPFFAALEGALTDDIVDVAWTQIAVNDARELQIDFTCPTFFTTYRITAGASIGSAPPPVDGPMVPVACIAVFCTLTVPAPFELVDVGLSGPHYDALLYDTASEYDYNVGAVDEYEFLMENECPTCEFVDIDPVGSSSLAPATRQATDPLASGRPTPSPTSSVCGSGDGLVTAAVVGAFAAAGIAVF